MSLIIDRMEAIAAERRHFEPVDEH